MHPHRSRVWPGRRGDVRRRRMWWSWEVLESRDPKITTSTTTVNIRNDCAPLATRHLVQQSREKTQRTRTFKHTPATFHGHSFSSTSMNQLPTIPSFPYDKINRKFSILKRTTTYLILTGIRMGECLPGKLGGGREAHLSPIVPGLLMVEHLCINAL